MNKTNTTSRLTVRQWIWLVIAVFALVAGFALGLLGFLRDLLNLPYQDNWIRIAENAMNEFLQTDLPWTLWGTFLLGGGAIILTLLLNRLANLEEAAKEKAARRAQRLQDASLAE